MTHALAFCLSEDPKLLRQFIRWTTGKAVSRSSTLEVLEQSLPGEEIAVDEDEAQRRGLPDMWIHDSEHWSLVVECKVSSPASLDQLRRHSLTAQRRGFDDTTVLFICVELPKRSLPEWVTVRKWTEVYVWLKTRAKESEWAKRAAAYLEVAESRFVEDGSLKEGTLTVFSGVPFDERTPYNYPEAKRVLKLAIDQLRSRKDLVRQLGMNPKGIGRGAITGTTGNFVWDFLRLKHSPNSESFTKSPHLTLTVERDLVLAGVTIPHMVTPALRNNVTGLGFEGFRELMEKVNSNLITTLKDAQGAAPHIIVLQRHYLGQRSAGVVDANLRFDLRTAFPSVRNKSKVKVQREWLKASYDALSRKRSNLQVIVGALFPYQYCSMCKSPKIIDHIAGTWIACKPMVDVMLKGSWK